MANNNPLFTGEVMTCEKCGWKMQSSKGFESMWTIVQVDDKLLYFCPKCWGIPRHHWPKETREAWDNDHKT